MKILHPIFSLNHANLLLCAQVLLAGFVYSDPGDPVATWNNKQPLNEVIFSAPAIGPTGTVIFGTKIENIYNPLDNGGNVYAYNPIGTIKWKFPSATGPDWFESPPAIAADGTVYIGCWNNVLYAINGTNGSEIWQFSDQDSAVLDGAMTAAPAIGPDGSIYIGSTNGNMYAVSDQGNELWTYETDPELLSPILAGAVFSHNGDTLYFGDGDGTLHAVNRMTGEPRWTYSVPPEHDLIVKPGEREISASAALDSQGNIYFTCENGLLYMLSPTGNSISEFAVSDSILCSPVIDADDRVYLCSRDTYLYCIARDSTGVLEIEWDMQVGDVLYSSPAMDELGNVIVAGYWEDSILGGHTKVRSVSSNGVNLWTYPVATINDASPAIAPDSSIYIGGYDGKMYKFEGAAPLSISGWPHQGANRRQTGLSADITAIDLIDLFPGIEYDVAGGPSYVPWFGVGWIQAAGLPVIDHGDHGLLHIVESNASGIIYYDKSLNRWLFAYNSAPNYLYDPSSQKWLYHAKGSSVDQERWFFDFSVPGWISESEL